MIVEQLRETIRSEPFRPFIMHLADGRELPVHHRDFIMVSPHGRTVAVYQSNDTMNIVDLLLVTDLEVKPPRKSGKNGNGREKL